MTTTNNQGLYLLIDALQEASCIQYQYNLHQHVGSTIDDLIDQINQELNQ